MVIRVALHNGFFKGGKFNIDIVINLYYLRIIQI